VEVEVGGEEEVEDVDVYRVFRAKYGVEVAGRRVVVDADTVCCAGVG
jgi:hypothetical protein